MQLCVYIAMFQRYLQFVCYLTKKSFETKDYDYDREHNPINKLDIAIDIVPDEPKA